jgi:hypothetical protein
VLGTDSHELPYRLEIGKHVDPKAFSFALRLLNETGKHANGSCFACSVLTEKCENLTLVHFDVQAFNSMESIVKLFLKPFNSKVASSGFLPRNFRSYRLIILRFQVSHLHTSILIASQHAFTIFIVNFTVVWGFFAAAIIAASLEAEARA